MAQRKTQKRTSADKVVGHPRRSHDAGRGDERRDHSEDLSGPVWGVEHVHAPSRQLYPKCVPSRDAEEHGQGSAICDSERPMHPPGGAQIRTLGGSSFIS